MFDNLKLLKSYFNDKVELLRYRHILPSNMRHDDLYIVEFPKSGITWLSTIIANTCFLEEGMNKEATHYNLEQIIGDIHVTEFIGVNSSVYPYHRIIKSHTEYNPYYRHVIYIIRNPFSVMNSYYNYLVSNKLFKGNFESFVRDSDFGISKWKKHVESWVIPKRNLKLHLIRYEDLIDTPDETIANLYRNLGWKINDSIKKEALELSCFEHMKELDNLYKYNCPFRGYDFVREGKKTPEIDSASRKYIYENSVSFLEKFYPDILVKNYEENS